MENQVESNQPVLYPKGGEITFLMPSTNFLGKLKDAEPTRSLTAKYMTIDEWANIKGKELRCVFLGMKEAIDSDGKQYYLAKFTDGKLNFVAAQTILVQSFLNVPIGQGVSITCKDVVPNSKKGKTALFEIDDLGFNVFENNE